VGVAAGEPDTTPLAPSVPMIVTTNAPPGMNATPLPQPRSTTVTNVSLVPVPIPRAYGLGNIYPLPPDTDRASAFRTGVTLPNPPPTPQNVPTAQSLFSKALQKPRLNLPPPPPPMRTLPAVPLSEAGTPTGSPIAMPRTNAPPAGQEEYDPWTHRDKPLRDVEYKW
jgi:hypothetical protein